MEIKKAETTDLESSFSVINQCAIDLRKKGMNNWDRYTKDKVLDIIRSNEMFLLLVDNEVVGTINISQVPPSFFDASDMEKWESPDSKAYYFTLLATSPNHQGKGYGSCLIGFAEEFAKNENAEYLRLTMFPNNKPLKDYYLNKSFVFRHERVVDGLNLKLSFGEKKLV
ncbi:GNAT family N-acetyltransferase [Belliella marina]|uniref:GNAT family N-acetyltransferase n=1 Tax=Belliella marina TaxID=1644146 RepID=UPI00366C4626